MSGRRQQSPASPYRRPNECDELSRYVTSLRPSFSPVPHALRVMCERHSIAGTGRMLGRKPGWTRSIASASLARANPILNDMPLIPPNTFHRTTPAI
ncbi:unnamed protein product [Tilletia controversa]|nr:unnamed protein product [Tilletia controversa]